MMTFTKRVFPATVVLLFAFTSLRAQWVRISGPVSGDNIIRLASIGSNILAGTQSHGMYVSTNMGTSWTHVTTGLPDTEAVTFIAAIGNRAVAGSGHWGNFFFSSDSGWTWAMGRGLGTVDWNGIVKGDSAVYTRIDNNLFVSYDTAMTWSEWSGYFAFNNITVYSLSAIGRDFYVGTQNGVYLSTDNGQTWNLATPHSPVYQVVSLVQSGGNILAGTQFSGVYRSSAGRQGWEKSDSGLTGGSILSLNPVTNDAVVLIPLQQGFGDHVWISTDAGSSWSNISAGLDSSYVSCITVSGGEIYAGTYAHGLWKRPLSEVVTAVSTPKPDVPDKFSLSQNYPNPFNPTTVIRYQLSAGSRVSLKVYDVLGRLVRTLVNNEVEKMGRYEVQFDGSDLPSGVYFYRIEARPLKRTASGYQAEDYFQSTKKLMLLK